MNWCVEDIRIDVGVDTILQVDLSDINFLGVEAIIFTIKNQLTSISEAIIERRFTEAKIYDLIISAEESKMLQDGAQYDFQKVLINGIRVKLTENGRIKLQRAVGDKID